MSKSRGRRSQSGLATPDTETSYRSASSTPPLADAPESRDGQRERDARAGEQETRQASPSADDGAVDEQQVRERAYQLYVQRGDAPGSETDDWLQAEREVRERARSRASDASGAQPEAPAP